MLLATDQVRNLHSTATCQLERKSYLLKGSTLGEKRVSKGRKTSVKESLDLILGGGLDDDDDDLAFLTRTPIANSPLFRSSSSDGLPQLRSRLTRTDNKNSKKDSLAGILGMSAVMKKNSNSLKNSDEISLHGSDNKTVRRIHSSDGLGSMVSGRMFTSRQKHKTCQTSGMDDCSTVSSSMDSSTHSAISKANATFETKKSNTTFGLEQVKEKIGRLNTNNKSSLTPVRSRSSEGLAGLRASLFTPRPKPAGTTTDYFDDPVINALLCGAASPGANASSKVEARVSMNFGLDHVKETVGRLNPLHKSPGRNLFRTYSCEGSPTSSARTGSPGPLNRIMRNRRSSEGENEALLSKSEDMVKAIESDGLSSKSDHGLRSFVDKKSSLQTEVDMGDLPMQSFESNLNGKKVKASRRDSFFAAEYEGYLDNGDESSSRCRRTNSEHQDVVEEVPIKYPVPGLRGMQSVGQKADSFYAAELEELLDDDERSTWSPGKHAKSPRTGKKSSRSKSEEGTPEAKLRKSRKSKSPRPPSSTSRRSTSREKTEDESHRSSRETRSVDKVEGDSKPRKTSKKKKSKRRDRSNDPSEGGEDRSIASHRSFESASSSEDMYALGEQKDPVCLLDSSVQAGEAKDQAYSDREAGGDKDDSSQPQCFDIAFDVGKSLDEQLKVVHPWHSKEYPDGDDLDSDIESEEGDPDDEADVEELLREGKNGSWSNLEFDFDKN